MMELSTMQVTLMDGDDDGSAYILDVTPEEANHLKTGT